MRLPRLLLLTLTTCLASTPLFAQDAPSAVQDSGKKQFRADFFVAYSPVTALEMVQRIPGFSIEGSDGLRGFGDNAGNVLIDGDRPSTKSDDIFAILERIPANQVDYIELNEQGGSDSDTRGQGQTVNVIRKGGAALSGKYEANLEVGERRGVTPFGNASASLKRGNTTFELSGGYFAQLNGFRGSDVERSGRGVFISRREEEGDNFYTESDLAAAIKTKVGTTKINLNGRIEIVTTKEARDANVFGTGANVIAVERLSARDPFPETNIEIGGDIELPLLTALKTKVVGLFQSGRTKGASQFSTITAGQPDDLFSTRSDNRPREIIGRVQNDWSGIKSHAIQFGGEIALNRLDARFAAQSSSGGATTVFPASNVLISETRFEPFISDIWSLSKAWQIEGGIIAESSRIQVSGDSVARRSFLFWKPRFVATWTVNPKTTIELRAERRVAQLDFNDFATSVDVGTSGQVDAGNADLVPEKTTTVSALIRRKFLDRGSIQLLGSYVRVSDTQDLVPIIMRDASGAITSRFDGAGNIGKSTRWNAELEVTLPFDWLTKPLGITGMELKYVGHYHGSRVTDPITGLSRSQSNEPLWHQSFNFRHDIKTAGISWGVDTNIQAASTQFFFDQIRSFRAGPEVFVFAEYKKLKIGTLRFQVANVTDVSLTRDRIFFRDTRASGDIIRSFHRNRSRDSRFKLSLTGTF